MWLELKKKRSEISDSLRDLIRCAKFNMVKPNVKRQKNTYNESKRQNNQKEARRFSLRIGAVWRARATSGSNVNSAMWSQQTAR
jgi:hypothetical protein